MAPTAVERLAAWVSALQPADVPADQHRLGRFRILDSLGLIAVGARLDAGRAMSAWADVHGQAEGRATNLATGSRMAPASTVLVHGTLAHARDFDDTFIDAVLHPASTVVPVALALAESADAPITATTTAIAAGYEVAARLGRLAGRGFHARGFHATAIVGPVAAAATASRMMGLDADRTADAMSLATSMSGGLMAFLADGGWSKWLHTGWSAHGGLIAAQVAASGFRGPRHAVEHPHGLFGAFLGEVPTAIDTLDRELGRHWAGSEARFKLYPCAHVIHPYLDAAIGLNRSRGAAAALPRSVLCRLAPWAIPIVTEPRAPKLAPRTELEAIASLPFMLAAALLDGTVTLDTLSPATLRRVDLAALAARIECQADAALGAGFDGSMEVHLDDGRQITIPVALPANDEAAVRAKFRTNWTIAGNRDPEALEASLDADDATVAQVMQLAADLSDNDTHSDQQLADT